MTEHSNIVGMILIVLGLAALAKGWMDKRNSKKVGGSLLPDLTNRDNQYMVLGGVVVVAGVFLTLYKSKGSLPFYN